MIEQDWELLEADLCRCSLHGPGSLKRSIGTAFLPGELLPAPGRALPGWDSEACEALIVERLRPAGFQIVGGIIPATEMVDYVDSPAGPPITAGLIVANGPNRVR